MIVCTATIKAQIEQKFIRKNSTILFSFFGIGEESRSFMSNDKGPDPIINHLGPML